MRSPKKRDTSPAASPGKRQKTLESALKADAAAHNAKIRSNEKEGQANAKTRKPTTRHLQADKVILSNPAKRDLTVVDAAELGTLGLAYKKGAIAHLKQMKLLLQFDDGLGYQEFGIVHVVEKGKKMIKK